MSTRQFTPEHRRKLSEARKARTGERSSFYGRRHTETSKEANRQSHLGRPGTRVGHVASAETRLKLSIAHTGKCGPLGSNWQGGKTAEARRVRNSPEYAEWRTAVFERDGYTCQDCGARGCYVEAHHIMGFADYPDLRLDVDNGLTLCRPCHDLTKVKASV